MPDNIEAVKEYPVPKCVKDVRSFIGFAGYYRRFVEKFSQIAKPLTELTHNDRKFQWETEEQAAFDQLKEKLITAPTLAYPDENAPTQIHTDASGTGMGSTLVQIQDGKERVVAYASQKLTPTQQRMSTTEREFLAVAWVVKKFRPYVYGRPFDIITDHHSLCHMLKMKEPQDKLIDWILYLQQFNFTVKYKSGKTHLDADSLSRYPIGTAAEETFSLCSLGLCNIKDEQAKDANLNKIIEDLNSIFDDQPPKNPKKDLQNYSLQDGILYKANYNPMGRLWLLCVPKSMQLAVIKSVHDDPTGGHLGLAKTLSTLKCRFSFPFMTRILKRYLAGCRKCQQFNRTYGLPSGLLQIPDHPNRPFQRIGIDFIGPYPISHKRNKYVCVIVDHLTRFVEAVPITAATANNAMAALKSKIFYRHSIPESILHDQGRQFLSKEYKNELKDMGIKHIMTSPYHPQTNGMTERFNETLKRTMAKYTSEDQKDWDEWIPAACFAYNTSVHDVTGHAPYYLLYGREPTLPVDLLLPVNQERLDDNESNHVNDRMDVALEETRQRTMKIRERDKARYDLHHRHVDYQVGDEVWRYAPHRETGKNEKLLANWSGPFQIVKKMSDVTYQLQDFRNRIIRRRKPFYLHVNDLKPFTSELEDLEQMTSETESDVDSLDVQPSISTVTARTRLPAKKTVVKDTSVYHSAESSSSASETNEPDEGTGITTTTKTTKKKTEVDKLREINPYSAVPPSCRTRAQSRVHKTTM